MQLFTVIQLLTIPLVSALQRAERVLVIDRWTPLEDEYGIISGLSLWCGPPWKQHHTDTHLPAIYTG